MNQIENERVVLSRRNEEENSPLKFVRSRRIRELAEAESTMKKERDDGARRSLAGLPESSSLGFSSGLSGAQRDLVRADGARRGLAGLLGSSSGLLETR